MKVIVSCNPRYNIRQEYMFCLNPLNEVTGSKGHVSRTCILLWTLLQNISLAVYLISSFHPIWSGIQNLWKHEKLSAITFATLLHPSSSHQIHLIFPHISPSLSVCVGQLSGLLPVKLHERTGGSTFLLNIALHSGDSLPCLSLPLPSMFLHSCTVKSNLSRGLHFYLRHSSPCLLLFFVG